MKIISLLASWQRSGWFNFKDPMSLFVFVCSFGLWILLGICNFTPTKINIFTIIIFLLIFLLLKLAMYYSWKTIKTDFEDEFGVEYKLPYYDYDELRKVHEYVHNHTAVLAWKIHNFSGSVPKEWKKQFRYALKLAHLMGFESSFETIKDYTKSKTLTIE